MQVKPSSALNISSPTSSNLLTKSHAFFAALLLIFSLFNTSLIKYPSVLFFTLNNHLKNLSLPPLSLSISTSLFHIPSSSTPIYQKVPFCSNRFHISFSLYLTLDPLYSPLSLISPSHAPPASSSPETCILCNQTLSPLLSPFFFSSTFLSSLSCLHKPHNLSHNHYHSSC